MKIIAVVGTGSGCGKTTVACQVLRAIPGLGAVKISPRDGVSRVEWGAGAPGKDTDLYGKNGAALVARIVGPRESVGSAWELIKDRFAGCPGVVMEGASALGIPAERYGIFVVGDITEETREQRNKAIAARTDVTVSRLSPAGAESLAAGIRAFLSRPVG